MDAASVNGSIADAVMNKTNDKVVCYSPTMITANGVWQGDNPLEFSLPLFILQLALIVIITHFIVFILKPLRQPRVVSEILGGIVLGPSVLGRSKTFAELVFPLRSVMVLETMANLGLLYFVFMVGVEMDLTAIRRTGKKSLTIAISGMVLPFLVGCCYALYLNHTGDKDHSTIFFVFTGVAISVTAFPVLARILAELKLLNTEMGRMALSSSIINDIISWVLLAIGISLAEDTTGSLASMWVVLSTGIFVVFCIFIIRPAIDWISRRTPDGENFNDFHICLILTGVMVCGFITDTLGTHAIFGAFVFGLIIPNGPLGTTIIEKLEDFVSGLLLPLFFAISGLRTNVKDIGGDKWVIAVFVMVLASAGKVLGTVLICPLFNMTMREGITLGILMNTKGLIEMIALNIGRDQHVFDEKTFSLMVINAVLMTSVITPAISIIYRPAKRFIPYKRRTIQSSKPHSELRILACIHTPRNVPTIINLLEASHPTKKSPISVYALHLVELTGRASAMLIVHNTRKSGGPAVNRTQAQSDHIINAFENYEQYVGGVSVQPLTAISPYSTMHEDICSLAEDKRIAFIIIPFHKQQTVDGSMEATNPAFRTINQNVLANAPCSVGILIDRGLGGSARLTTSHIAHHIAMLFFGGPDDREALSYGRRMAEHPGVSLTVVRFLPGEDTVEPTIPITESQPNLLRVVTEHDREKKIDEEFISEFRVKSVSNDSIVFMEKKVNTGEGTVAVIRSMDNKYDLYIVGRGQGMISPLTAGLTDWSECPELGAIGDLLATSDFGATMSVLVVQQYVGAGQYLGDGLTTPDSAAQ